MMNTKFKIGDCFVLDGEILEVKGIDKGYYICCWNLGKEIIFSNVLTGYADKYSEKLPF